VGFSDWEMEILYIEAKRKNLKTNILKSEIRKLPKILNLGYIIQYKDLAKEIKKQLELNKIHIEKFQQVLGCSRIDPKIPLFFIGDGKFHLINLYSQNSNIYYLNILKDQKIKKISKKEIEKIRINKKVCLIKFLNAKKIGLLITTKPGQENLNSAINFKKILSKKNKIPYIFISNNIDINQFQNFEIDIWVNFSCPGLKQDSKEIINYTETKRILKLI